MRKMLCWNHKPGNQFKALISSNMVDILWGPSAIQWNKTGAYIIMNQYNPYNVVKSVNRLLEHDVTKENEAKPQYGEAIAIKVSSNKKKNI